MPDSCLTHATLVVSHPTLKVCCERKRSLAVLLVSQDCYQAICGVTRCNSVPSALHQPPVGPQGDLSESGPVLMIKQDDLFEDIAIDVQEIAASWRKPIRIGCLAASDV